jgi:signal transduction histidine kinase
VTEHKLAEEALSQASRRVIEAEEQERTRIARDLHDNINQRLALLSVETDVSKRNPPSSAADMSRLLTELRERIVEISSEVQSISHQLHSSQLEYLGIAAAVKGFCHEFAAGQKVEIDFTQDEIPKSVPPEVSLCLFRVLQEALHNAIKHSHVRHFAVSLGYSANQLHLTVSDRGTGFDVERATNKGGLGLTSMRERVRLVNGTIAIDSKPMGGATIHVRVPLESEHAS